MRILLTLLALGLLGLILFEGFETIILPRSVSRGFRFTRGFFISFWGIWRGISRLIPDEDTRESFIAFFGPLSLITIFIAWASLLIVGFALMQIGHGVGAMTNAHSVFDMVYFSGVTFTTLGYGDITPKTHFGKIWAVAEGGTGFGFLAIIIGYLPVIYQAFSRREVAITLLDARAGSPPTAGEMLYRYGSTDSMSELAELLREWEIWTSDVLESHLSYPVLAFYRSQHSHQSWISSLTSILDTTAIILVGLKDGPKFQAKLTFAMARHAAVDLGIIFHVEPDTLCNDRLPPKDLDLLRRRLADAGIPLSEDEDVMARLTKLRQSYEPFMAALSERFMMPLPPFIFENPGVDNWMSSGLDNGILR